MQDSLSKVLDFLDLQIGILQELDGIEAEQKGLIQKGDIDAILELLKKKDGLLQEYASVDSSVNSLILSMGFANVGELLDSMDSSADSSPLVDRLNRLQEYIKSVVKKEDEAIEMLKANLNSIKEELENLSAGRRIIESYYKIPKGVEPRFFDKKR